MADRIPLDAMTSDQLDALHDELEALRNAPILRTCLMPGCLRQFDIGAHMSGTAPARPTWSGDGWRALGAGSIVVAGGHICPDHADLIAAHLPARVMQDEPRRVAARCSCGWWTSPFQRWHGAARGLWEEHLLAAAEPTALPAPATEETR